MDSPLYPTLSSFTDEAPNRSLRSDGGLLYEPIHMDADVVDQRTIDDRKSQYPVLSPFSNHYRQHDDGTFMVLSRQSRDNRHTLRI